MLSLFLGTIFVSAATGTATTSVFGSYKASNIGTLTEAVQLKIPFAKNICPVADTSTEDKAAETWPEQGVKLEGGDNELQVIVAPRTAGAAGDTFTFVVKTGQEWGILRTFHDRDDLKSLATLDCDNTDSVGTRVSFYPSKDCESPRYTLQVTENDYHNETKYVFTAASTAPKKVSDKTTACGNLLYNKPADKNAWTVDTSGCKFNTGAHFSQVTSTTLKKGAVTFQHSLSDTSAAVESPEVYLDEVTEEISDLTISTSSSAGRGRGNVTWKFTAKAASAGQLNGYDGITSAEKSRKILSNFFLTAGNVDFERPSECYMYQGTAAAKSNEVHYTDLSGNDAYLNFFAPKFEAGEVVITCNNARNPVSAEVNTTFGYVKYTVYAAVTGDTVCKGTTAADNGLTKAGTNTNKIYLHQSIYKGYAPLGAVAEADFDGACSVGGGVLGSFLVVAASLMSL